MNALTKQTQERLHRWWPFVLLLAISASRWMVADEHPNVIPSLVSAALGCSWAALVAFTLFSRQLSLKPSPAALRSLIAGAMLLGGPAIGLVIGAHQLGAGALTIALALTPVAVAVGVSASGASRPDGIAGRIWPGLAAVTGLLLILIQPNLGDIRTDIALLLAPILTGLGATLFYSQRADRLPSPAFALIGAAALFTFSALASAAAAGHIPKLSLPAIAYDGILALLGVVSLARLGPTRWSSQFTWLPLLILLEGILLVRPPVTARWVIGLALMAIAGVYLLLPQAGEFDTDPPTLLR